MRVVQVANFYGPRSGGLRTAVDRLGAEYTAAGHDVFLVVPGAAPRRGVLGAEAVDGCAQTAGARSVEVRDLDDAHARIRPAARVWSTTRRGSPAEERVNSRQDRWSPN